MSPKTAAKPAVIPQEHGGALLAGGMPGNKGGPGRPPDEFKRRMRALLDRPSVEKYLAECLDWKHGESAYYKALEFAAERGEGKVPNVTKVEGGDTPLKLLVVGSLEDLPKGE